MAICALGNEAPALVRPGHIWSRQEAGDWLLDGLPPHTLVGLDLGASLPFADHGAYFPGWADSPQDARSLWTLVERICGDDPHLSAASFIDHPDAQQHFRRHGGRKGRLFEGRGRLRETELEQRAQGLNPYSNLNLVGAAQVGKSSLTGMRVLYRASGRIAVWPFDPPGPTTIVEIYTTIAALAGGRTKGRAKMRSIEELNAALIVLGSAPVFGSGAIDDHKSDALLSAAWLRGNAHRPELWHPAGMTQQIAATEGWTFGIA